MREGRSKASKVNINEEVISLSNGAQSALNSLRLCIRNHPLKVRKLGKCVHSND